MLQLFSWVAGVGVLLLPIGVGIDMLLRSRGWQLVQALLAAGLAAGIAMLIKAAILDGQFTQVLAALTRPLHTAGRTNPWMCSSSRSSRLSLWPTSVGVDGWPLLHR